MIIAFSDSVRKKVVSSLNILEGTKRDALKRILPSSIDKIILNRIAENESKTTSMLVQEISDEAGCEKDLVVERLLKLSCRNEIKIVEKELLRSFSMYVRSPYTIRFWVYVVVTTVSFLSIFISNGLFLDIRFVFGATLLLYLPGYSIMAFLFAQRELDGLTDTALSMVLSVILAVLIGVVLNFTVLGITLFPVAVWLTSLTLGLLIASQLRKYTYYKLAKLDLGKLVK